MMRSDLSRISATSPSSRNTKRRVTGSSAATSEATKFSFSPMPITTGQPSRASTMRSRSSLRHDGERVRALELGDGRAHRLEQVARDLQVVVDAVRDDLGIGLRRELVAGLDQLGAQFVVVLDDAVVDDRDAVLRDVRVRVALARHAVRRPPRVRDAEIAVRGVGVERVLELADLADGAQPLDVAGAVQHGDARGVVAAILEPPQALEEHRNDVAFGYGTNDSTHGRILTRLRRGRGAPF